MKVLKFGGTSVGTAESINNVRTIIESVPGSKMIVLSAMSGVTNYLVTITEKLEAGNREQVEVLNTALQIKHLELLDKLIPASERNSRVRNGLNKLFDEFNALLSNEFSENNANRILTFGETMLTYLFSEYLAFCEINNKLLDAKRFMYVGNLENPDTDKVAIKIAPLLDSGESEMIYITQGFVRIDKFNRVSTLKRGGSDYTSTILGAALNAEEVQIWTDIDGFHNNDPRYVEDTHPLANLTFEEAAELAYFGAKILHPQTISPVIDKNIPIYLKNTFTPLLPGTKISSEINESGLKAISAKDGITAIKIKSNRMLMAHGFLKKIFEIFDNLETAIDMITTSEIAISLTIDDTKNLDLILDQLNGYGDITVEMDHSIICIVGEGLIKDPNTFKLFEILNEIPVRMISYGGSLNNVSLLVATENKVAALKALHKTLFIQKERASVPSV
ncbi:aspartate kinase [Gillisia mitskevichiae]|uniref:Aspartokinase n=1 Tax=Gillisia mitskevichiae TaxID=270921 RepID=A0A495PQT5_9FLAO|nr:aspartate kinase [Gillisia mitskevichiae]RKS53011.1 aspartate kinase [Gillisia mitskevichiae]